MINYQSKIIKNVLPLRLVNISKFLKLDEIDCFLSQHKTTYLVTKHGRQYPLEKSLEEIDGLLSPKTFFRINRAYIIHINAIKDIISYSNSRLKVVLNQNLEDDLIVSRERVKDFKGWLDG